MLSFAPALTLALSSSVCFVTASCSESNRFLGRVNPSTRELTWPGSGIAVVFNGTFASIPITSQWGDPSIELVVDNGTPIEIDHVTGTSIDTPAGLTKGPHTFQIRKKSETYFGSLYLGEPTTNGILIPLEKPKRRIEIIGDSISAGYGLEGEFPCVNAANNEAATKTYGALTAKNLSADYSIVAWSGKGVTRNYVTPEPDTSPLLPELWTRYGANDEDNSYDFATPVDVVVINLGTNDFSFDLAVRPQLNMTEFTVAYVEFVEAVHSKYPGATIFLTSSPLLGDWTDEQQKTKQVDALKATMAQLDFVTHFVDFPTQDSSNNNIGCDYHPSARTNQEMAIILTAAIKGVTGWS